VADNQDGIGTKVFTITTEPGVKRDGTTFDARNYSDGIWNRFQRGRPKKIGGYREMFNTDNISRGIILNAESGINYIFSGYDGGIDAFRTGTNEGFGAGPYPITFTATFDNKNAIVSFASNQFVVSGNLISLYRPGSYVSFNTSSTTPSSGATAFRITSATYNSGTNRSTIEVFGSVPSLSTYVWRNVNFFADDRTQWQFDIGFNPSGTGNLQVLAHGGLNLLNIDNAQVTPIFAGNMLPTNGDVFSMTALADTAGTSPTGQSIQVDGGVVMLHPFIFAYGSNGLIINNHVDSSKPFTLAGSFSDWNGTLANQNNVSSAKILRGYPVRGGSNSPAGLFWAADSLIRVSFTGSAPFYWRYEIISSQISCMSGNSIVEMDGSFFWAGTDRFYVYNGTVSVLPNDNNVNYFFDNLNYVQRSKVWASKVPRFNEVWFFYPRGNATECTDAVIYNVKDRLWYDAGQAVGARRSAGYFTEIFRYPVWSGWEPDQETERVSIWQHEFGVDRVKGPEVSAIEAGFTTCDISWVGGSPAADEAKGIDRQLRIERIEPDFLQSGEMTVVVEGRGYASGVDQKSLPYSFDPDTPKIYMREQRRELRLVFNSNIVGGFYEAGRIIISCNFGDERPNEFDVADEQETSY
jgi:hypothetical protein